MARPFSISETVAQPYAPEVESVPSSSGANTASDTHSTHNLKAVTQAPKGPASMRIAPVPPEPKRQAFVARIQSSIQANMMHWLLAMISIGGLFAFWYFATEYRLDFYVRFNNIPKPSEVLGNAMELFRDDRFQTNIVMSLERILAGFSIATVLGVAMGLVCGRYKVAKSLIFPAMEILRPIPAIAWVPMSIMLWPTTEGSIVFITFIGSFFPILINTIAGVDGVDPVLIRAAKALGASESVVIRQVILPAAMPNVFTGLSVGMGVAWVSLIAAEMISGQFGVGYFTWESYALIEYANIVLGMIVIGVLGLACSGGILFIGRLLMPWMSLNQHGGGK